MGIKIIIKQGDTSELYSIDDRSYKSFIRLDGMSISLKAEEIKSEIIKRKTSPKEPLKEDNFIDPEPEKYLDIVEEFSRRPFKGEKANVNDGEKLIQTHFSTKKFVIKEDKDIGEKLRQPKSDEFITTIKLQKIPSSVTDNEVIDLFKIYNLVKKKPYKIVRDPSTKEGWGFINFLDKNEGNKLLCLYFS